MKLGLTHKLAASVSGAALLCFLISNAWLSRVVDGAHRTEVGAVLAAAFFSLVVFVTALGHRFVRIIENASEGAKKMAAGNWDIRLRVRASDELDELAHAMNRLAKYLSRALRDLEDERDVLTSILDGMLEGVLLVSPDGRIQRVNASLREMLFLDGDLAGKPLLEVLRHAELKSLFEGGGASTGEIDVEALKPRRLLVRTVPLADRSRGTLGVFVDVTDMRRLESLRKDFVANVSHELRTPVTSLRSASETLLGGAKNDPKALSRFLEIIDRNAERLHRLVEDLLDLSRIEAKDFRLREESILLEPFLEHVLMLLQARAEAAGVPIALLVKDRSLSVLTDRRALEQIVHNLVDNAIKYCPGQPIRIRAEDTEEGVEIRVDDTGPGIAEEHLPRLFERFYRVDLGRSRAMGGTGLGLSIVKHLVEALGGAISVASTVGQGTSFVVNLPKKTPSAPEAQPN